MPAIEADKASGTSARVAERLAAAVREAGALALSLFQTPIRNWTKGPSSSPVCEADIAVDKLIRERLTTGGDDGIAWLSEESADDGARLGRWLVHWSITLGNDIQVVGAAANRRYQRAS